MLKKYKHDITLIAVLVLAYSAVGYFEYEDEVASGALNCSVASYAYDNPVKCGK